METLSSRAELHYLPGCAPENLDQLGVEVLGDFPPSDNPIVSFDARYGEDTLTSLEAAARVYRISVTTPRYLGYALAPALEDSAQQALVLPNGTPCSVPFQALPALAAAAVAVSESGDVLVAGGVGTPEGTAVREAAFLRVSEARVAQVAEGLYVPRAGACAVSVGAENWVVGGAQSLREGTPALDSLERFDVATTRFVGLGRLRAPRVGARALRLFDGSVLVAGGQDVVGGKELASLERLEPSSAEGSTLDVTLPWQGPLTSAVLRDDGRVLLAAQTSEGPALALLDPAAQALDVLEEPEGEWDPALVVPLPGERAAFFETHDELTTGVLWLRLPDGSYEKLARWFNSFAGLSQARATALPDGRVLLTGLSKQKPTSRVIDPSRSDVRIRELAVLPELLLSRGDQSVLELAADGAQILREDARTSYDNPGGTLLADDADVLALDAPTRWVRDGLSLVAQAALARFDVTVLRYERVRMAITVDGPSELLLRRADGAERLIALGGKKVGPAFCTLASKPGETVLVERDGPSVSIQTAEASRRCTLDGLEGPIALALRALEPGVRIASLEVTRK